jgi:hypothetical protein
MFTPISRVAIMTACSIVVVSPQIWAQSADGVPPEHAARMTKEKEARRACKIEICNGFAKPVTGAPIMCDVTKTWTKDEVINRVVGGSYVWGYGHVQCSLKVNLDRTALAKAMTEPKAEFALPPYKVSCNVEDKDPTKGIAFPVTVSFTPTLIFEKGAATTIKVDDVKTEGSALATAAVTSAMGVEKVSGVVGRALAAELNDLIYSKCKDDGVEITRR